MTDRRRSMGAKAHGTRPAHDENRARERDALVMRVATQGIWDWDLARNEIDYSPLCMDLLGLGEEERAPRFEEWEQRIHPDDRERFRDELRAHWEGSISDLETEHRLRHRDGSDHWVLVRAVSARDADGKAVRTVGSIIDISDYRDTETRLRDALDEAREAAASSRRNEQRYALAAAGTHDGLWDWDLAQDQIYYSPRWKEILGLGEEEVEPRFEEWEQRVHPEDRSELSAAIQAHLDGLTPRFESEHRLQHRDGTYLWVRARGVSVRRSGTARRMAGTITDVTEYHTMEEKLLGAVTEAVEASEAIRRSEARYALVMNGTKDGLWDWDLESGEVYYSPRWKDLLGLEEVEPRFAEWEQRVHPDDRERFSEELQAHLEEILPYFENEHRLRHRDGEYRWFLARGTSVRDGGGKPLRMAGSITDISEQRTLERKLLAALAEERRAEAEKTGLLEMLAEISGTLDLNEILGKAQRRVAELVGCDHVFTFYWDPERRVTRIAAHYGSSADLREALESLELSGNDPISVRLATEGALVINDVADQSWFPVEQMAELRIRALVGMPIRVRGRMLGTCFACHLEDDGGAFTSEQVALLEGIARNMALALETAELYRTREHDLLVSETLIRVGREMLTSLGRPQALERMCRVTREALDCDCTQIWLAGADGSFVTVAGHGHNAEQWELITTQKIARSMVGDLLAQLDRDGLVDLPIPDPHHRVTGSTSNGLRDAGLTRVLCMPLRHDGRLIGVHQAAYRGRTEPFGRIQQRIAYEIGNLASVALEHVRAPGAPRA